MISNCFVDDKVGVFFLVVFLECIVRQEGFGIVCWIILVCDGGGIFGDILNMVVNGIFDVDDCQYEGELVDLINCLWIFCLFRFDYFGND